MEKVPEGMTQGGLDPHQSRGSFSIYYWDTLPRALDTLVLIGDPESHLCRMRALSISVISRSIYMSQMYLQPLNCVWASCQQSAAYIILGASVLLWCHYEKHLKGRSSSQGITLPPTTTTYASVNYSELNVKRHRLHYLQPVCLGHVTSLLSTSVFSSNIFYLPSCCENQMK